MFHPDYIKLLENLPPEKKQRFIDGIKLFKMSETLASEPQTTLSEGQKELFEKSAYEVIDAIIFDLNEIKQINDEQIVKKQLSRYLDKIHLVYDYDTTLISKIREFLSEVEMEQKLKYLKSNQTPNNTIQKLLNNIQELLRAEHIL